MALKVARDLQSTRDLTPDSTAALCVAVGSKVHEMVSRHCEELAAENKSLRAELAIARGRITELEAAASTASANQTLRAADDEKVRAEKTAIAPQAKVAQAATAKEGAPQAAAEKAAAAETAARTEKIAALGPLVAKSTALLAEFLNSPHTTLDFQNTGDTVGSTFGITLDTLLSPGSVEVVISKLSNGTAFKECWGFYGNRGKFDEMFRALDQPRQMKTAYALVVFLTLACLGDPKVPELKAFKTRLDISNPRGPIRHDASTNEFGGLFTLLWYFRTLSGANAQLEKTVIGWAKQRMEQVLELLTDRYAALDPALLSEVKAIAAPVPLEYVTTVDPDSGAEQKEGLCRLQCQGTIFPPEDVYCNALKDQGAPRTDYACMHYVAALARAVDAEFQSRVGKVIAKYNAATSANAAQRSAPCKTVGRMESKRKSDHKGKEWPSAGNNADASRCGITVPAEHMVGLSAAIADEVRRNGGEVVRVKNGMSLSEEEVAEQYGYRAVLSNYRLKCETVTYADVVPHMLAVGNDIIWMLGPCQKIAQWIENTPEVASQPVQFLCETQAMLPIYADSRAYSHFPYKLVRCTHLESPTGAAFKLYDDLTG